jgi:hypothetical protein
VSEQAASASAAATPASAAAAAPAPIHGAGDPARPTDLPAGMPMPALGDDDVSDVSSSSSDSGSDSGSGSGNSSDDDSISESSTSGDDDDGDAESDGDGDADEVEEPADDAQRVKRQRLLLTERLEKDLRDAVIKARALVEDLITVQIKPATKMLVVKLQDSYCSVSQVVARLPHAGIVTGDLNTIFEYIGEVASHLASSTALVEVLASDGEFANGLRILSGDTVQSLAKRAGHLADAALVAAKMAAGVPADSIEKSTKLSAEKTSEVIESLANTVVREMVPLPPSRLRDPWVGRARADEALGNPSFGVEDMREMFRAKSGTGTTSLEDKWDTTSMSEVPGDMDELLDILRHELGWCSDGFLANAGQMIRAWRVQRAAANNTATVPEMRQQLQQTLFEKEKTSKKLEGVDLDLFAYVPGLDDSGRVVMEDGPHKKKAFPAHMRKQPAKLKALVSKAMDAAMAESAERLLRAEVEVHGTPYTNFSVKFLQSEYQTHTGEAAKVSWNRKKLWQKLSTERREQLVAGSSHARSLHRSCGIEVRSTNQHCPN